MKLLKPIKDYDSYSDPIARAIFDMLDKAIFHPLYRILDIKITKQNALGTPLTEAIRTGDIQYVDGYFYGPLKAVISKELRGYGAVYNIVKKAYKLEISRIPQNVLQAIADSKQQNADQIKKVEQFLDAQAKKTMPPPEIGALMDTILEKLRKQFESTTKTIDASVIEIPFDPKFADEIKEAYTTNLDKYIQFWHDEQILRLREKVSQNVQAGYRAEKLIDTIMGERKVSFHKAMFLAKQETSLMTAKYREIRYADVGVTEYMWSTSHDSRVRHDHRELQGKIFRFDHPPVTNRHTMARNNPGEDYNCVPEDSRIDFTGIIEKCFRRWYSGELTTIITDSGKTIRATPNHPVLTINGWKPIGMLNNTDQLIDLCEELRNSFKTDHNYSIPTVGEIFESHRKSSLTECFPGKFKQFHGDGSNNNVDVIDSTRNLSFDGQLNIQESIYQFLFSFSNFFTFGISGFNQHSPSLLRRDLLSPHMRISSKCLSFLKRHFTHSYSIGLRDRTNGNISLNEPSSDNHSFQPCTFRDGELTFPGKISFDNRFWVNLKSVMRVVPLRIRHIESSWYNGYVYNFQTKQGYYTSTGVIVSNCRCVAIPVLSTVNMLEREYANN